MLLYIVCMYKIHTYIHTYIHTCVHTSIPLKSYFKGFAWVNLIYHMSNI